MLRERLTVLLVVLGLLVIGGVAGASAPAAEDDSVLNYGYDQGNQVFLWNVHPTDGLYDCSLEVHGTLTATYGITDEGLVVVAGLHDSEGLAVMFTPTPEDELGDEFEEPATESAAYSGPDGPCVVGGGEVAGPNGQVNHGMFMKLFNSQFEGAHRGCVARHIAKSSLGKGDQQVRVGDVDPDAEAIAEGTEGEVDFTTILTDCEKGKKAVDSEEGEGKVTGKEKAAEKKAAKEDRGRGKSSQAPGHNKNP